MGCVFLPAAGNRNGSTVNNAGTNGNYWSSTAYDELLAWYVDFNDGYAYPGFSYGRNLGQSVRLVCE